jgi:hypothetical protein
MNLCTVWMGCMGLLLGQPAADKWAWSPVSPEVARVFSERSLSLAAGDWQSTLGELSRQLGVPLVAMVPERHPLPAYHGKAGEILARLAQQHYGVWKGNSQLLCLVPALDRLPAKPITAEEVEKARERLRRRTLVPARFLFSLDMNQLKKLGQGKPITAADLKDITQRKMFLELLERQCWDHVDMLKQKRKIEPEKGQIYASLTFWGIILWRGSDIMGRPLSSWQADRYWSACQALSQRDWGKLAGQAEKFFQVERMHLEKPRIFSLAELGKVLSVYLRDKKELLVSAQVAHQQVLVSAGDWRVTDLVAAIALTSHVELRRIEEIVFLGPIPEALALQDEAFHAHGCDISWALYEPIIKSFKDNPRNDPNPLRFFSSQSDEIRNAMLYYSDFVPPRLIPWHALSSREKQCAHLWLRLSLFNTKGPRGFEKLKTEVIQKYAGDLELYLYPTLSMGCILDGVQFPGESGGHLSFPYTYGWLVTRFGRRGQLPAVTPPLPRGEQK